MPSLPELVEAIVVIITTVATSLVVIRRLLATTESRIETARRKIEATTASLNGALQDFCSGCPYPCWYKLAETQSDGTTVFTMHFLNDAYAKKFGKTMEEYVGQTDFQVWPKHIAQTFYNNDAAVLASGQPLNFIEEIPADLSNPTGPTVSYEFDKWPIKRDGRIGIAGMLRPITSPSTTETP